jgi:Tol biopolymer transport system component
MIATMNASALRLRSTALLIVAVGISSAALLQCVGDDPTTATIVDAGGSDTSVTGDSNADDAGPSTCAWDKPFNAPAALAGIPTDSAVEGHPSLSPDELTIYFHGLGGSLSDGSTGNDLYMATRTSRAAPFGVAVQLAISTPFTDGNASVSHDGTTLYYDSATSDGGSLTALWVAQRLSAGQAFTGQHLLASPPASSQAGISLSDGQPFITADDAEFWFTSRRDGGTGAVDIYSSLLSGGSFGAATEEALLNSSSSDYAPSLSFDRLTVYFSSGRPNGIGGGVDIWRSHRSTVADAFPAPVPVGELNSTSDEYGGWLSSDNCRYYFESRRDGNSAHIFLAERSP